MPPKQKDPIFAVLDPDQDYELSDWEKTELATRGFFGIYGPGTTFIRYPEGLAKRLPKGWRLLSVLTTRGMTSSAVSKVVNRSLQSRHCRRLRICRPSPARRESMTLVSSWPQKGQCMSC